MEPQVKWGFIDLDHYHLKLIEFVINDEHDMQLIVAHGSLHKMFKKQRLDMAIRRATRPRRQLLLAPNPGHLRRKPHLHRSQRFFDDVSSDSSSSDSASDSESDSKFNGENEDEKVEEDAEKNSLLSLGASIKSLLTLKNDRSFSVFHRRPTPPQNAMAQPQCKSANAYGATNHSLLQTIDDVDEEQPSRESLTKARSALLIDSSSVGLDEVWSFSVCECFVD